MSKESGQRSTLTKASEVAEYDFVQKHFEANGLGFGAGDLVMFGGTFGVLGEILAHALSYVEPEGGGRAVHRILLMHPPGPDDEEAVIRAIGDAIASGRGTKISPEEGEILSKLVRVVRIEDFGMESLLPALAQAEPRSVVVIRHAASYRAAISSGGGAAEFIGLPEDTWAPHLHALCARWRPRPTST